jgi:hypothetical protein
MVRCQAPCVQFTVYQLLFLPRRRIEAFHALFFQQPASLAVITIIGPKQSLLKNSYATKPQGPLS